MNPIVITGPSGWIGSAFLAMLAAQIGEEWPRHVRLFGTTSRLHSAPDGTCVPIRPLDEIGAADTEGAVVIHLAYLTKEKAALLGDRRFLDTNLAIDDALLAAIRLGRPRGVFVASSGAASLAADGRDRHPYGMCKLMQEDRFLRFGAETDVPVLAGRIFNLSGPFINKLESYAISSLLTQAFESGTIRITAPRPVYRSYLHVGDLCALIMLMLERRMAPARPMDFCGTEVVEMMDIASAAARVAGLRHDAILRDAVDTPCPTSTSAIRRQREARPSPAG
jgi:nucleoside-diphosphate-sugar epimerase